MVEDRKKEVRTMEWQFVAALVIAIPIILFPAVFIWFLNIGGIHAAIKEARAKRSARKQEVREAVKAK